MKRETRNVWVVGWGLLLVLFLGVGGVRAEEVIPAGPRQHYYQEINFLTDDATQGDIEIMLKDFERNVGRQIVLCVYPTMESELPVQAYGERVAAAWREGPWVKKDGVVILIFADKDQVAILPGEGLEKVLSAEDCGEIVSHDAMPGMRSGEHEGAVKNTLESVMLGVQGMYVRPSTIVVPARTWWDVLKQFGACACLLSIPVLVIIGLCMPTPKGVTYSSGGSGGSGWLIAFAVFSTLAGAGSYGGSSGGGGGFSSSGGGTFGGGGAGGKW